jgi:sugar porter (SP) family MFS transporter
LGALFGTFIVAGLADRLGRKKLLMLIAFSFLITTLGAAWSYSAFELGIWRFLQGVGVGGVSVLSPMYIAEIAPSNMRGRLVSVNQLSIIIGFLLATVSSYYFGRSGELESWRWMFGSALAPAVLFCIALFFIPESPRWLIKVQRQQEAIKVMQKIGDETYISNALNEIRASLNKTGKRGSYRELLGAAILPVLLIGFGLAILQQFSGANNVTAYLQIIFAKANISISNGLLNAVFIGLVYLVFTLLAMMLVDRMGRKKLMLIGTSLMGAFLFLLAWSFDNVTVNGRLVFIFIIAYVAVYSFTLAPVTWVLLSEIFPNYIRGKAMSSASGVLWLATFVVVLISPYLLKLSPVINFVIFGICNVIGIFFVWRCVPETKGKSLEEIERAMVTGDELVRPLK